MWHSEKVMLLACSLFLTLFFCNEYPAAPKYNGIGDCTKATIPPDLVLDSNQNYRYVEIYDFDKNLINTLTQPGPSHSIDSLIGLSYGSTSQRDTSNIFNFDIYWNGMDRNGNKVDNGKYIAKISFISKLDTSCTCMEIFVH